MILFIWACGDATTSQQIDMNNPDAYLFSGLHDGAAWTYRDDALSEDDEQEEILGDDLIKALHLENGEIELRRGLRWADAERVGELHLSDENGLRLEGWKLPFGDGEGDYPFSASQITENEAVSGDWSCLIERPEGGVETYYAIFENVFSFTCSGGGLEGRWSFAYDIGLIQFEGIDGERLDLVAPW